MGQYVSIARMGQKGQYCQYLVSMLVFASESDLYLGQYCLRKLSVFGSVLPEKTVSVWVSIACENC